MGITVNMNYQAEIDEWIKRYPCFSFLRTAGFQKDDMHRWTMNTSYWNYSNKIVYELQVMFIGKTGYGKSTTLNRLVGSEVFETSDISACTKEMFCSMYRMNPDIPTFFSISDLPGIGESCAADSQYYKWYKEMLRYSQVVVYLLRADQRDFSLDETLFGRLFCSSTDRSKVIIAMNYADKIEPVNRGWRLSTEQISNLNIKVNEISKIFAFPQTDIVYYSAVDGFNLEKLVEKIAKKLETNLKNDLAF